MPDILPSPAVDGALSVGQSAAPRLRVLRLVVSVGECNAAYNQFSLPVRDRYDTAICSFLPTAMPLAEGITLRDGDGTMRGFLRNVKRVLREEEFDIIHAHSPQLACLFLLANLANREQRQRLVFTAHNSYGNFKWRNRLLLAPAFLWSRRAICCGTAARDSFPKLFRLLAGSRLRAVANGVDLDRVDAATRGFAGPIENRFQVTSVGRLIPIKDPLALVRAFAKATGENARLTFLGDGALRPRVIEQSEEAGLADHIETTGVVPRLEVFQRLCQSSVFVSTSLGEGLPMAVLEAMACRCPVILSDIPPHREIALGTDFIPLVPPGDVNGFAEQIGRFQSLPDGERRDIGQACRRHVERHFSLNSMHAGYAHIYRELTNLPALASSVPLTN